MMLTTTPSIDTSSSSIPGFISFIWYLFGDICPEKTVNVSDTFFIDLI
ncbi:MAG TPA: hypothetical protein VF324_00040 [Methanobacterium sp.]